MEFGGDNNFQQSGQNPNNGDASLPGYKYDVCDSIDIPFK